MNIFATFGKNLRNIPEFGPNPVNNWLNTRWILNYLSRKHEDVVSSVVGYNGEIPWCLWSIQVTSDRVALTSRKYLILYWTFVLSVIFQSQNHVEHFDTVIVPIGSLGIWKCTEGFTADLHVGLSPTPEFTLNSYILLSIHIIPFLIPNGIGVECTFRGMKIHFLWHCKLKQA